MFTCQSGRHTWLNAADADKCCHPEWRRVLCIEGPGRPLPPDATSIVTDDSLGARYGRRWLRVEVDSHAES